IRRALLLAEGAGRLGVAEIRPEHIHFDSPARLVVPAIALPAASLALPAAPAEPTEEGFALPASHGRRRLAHIVQVSEARAIMETLAACDGNRLAAARQLGISERTLRYRLASMREAGLPVARAAARGG
ncbi:MAG TPA: helix-turn-helix domain-containing protein, partial [Novosphingobium sp.]|nr:helix-turn-helix domain-containing protein [Novosphingobium sp.]